MQVSGLSERYDPAFETYKINRIIPIIIADNIITDKRQLFGGNKKLKIFLKKII